MEAYLDNSATTRCYEEVKDIVVKTMMDDYGNPSAMHQKGVESERYVKEAAGQIAATLKVQEKEIYFTSGGTESNNWALIGTALANRRQGNHIIISSIEHPAVAAPAEFLESQGFEVTRLGVNAQGQISPEELKEAIRPETILVSVMFVNNEIGAVEPIAEIGELIKQVNPKTYFHVDAIQAYGKFRILPKKMHIDMLSASGHKIHGPKGTGFLYISEKMKGQKVILVTKDMNLRMKARSLGLQAEDYKTDQVEDLDFAINRSVREIEGIDTEVINRIYENANGVEVEQVFPKQELKGNNYYVLKNGNASVLACYDPVRRVIRKVEKPNVFGIYPKNAEQAFAVDALLNPNIQLVAISGKAGTGKTLLALASALQQNKQYEFIYLARPIVALSSKDLGFLPGDVNEKVDPYMQPLYDNLGFIKRRFNIHGAETRLIEEMQKEQKLMISALAYIRGRSLSDVYFIVDEAQNLTPHEVKTIITRAGEGTKMVFTGDIDQIDSPYLDKKSNGLSHLFDKMQGQDIFAHVHLEKGERSKLADLASDLL